MSEATRLLGEIRELLTRLRFQIAHDELRRTRPPLEAAPPAPAVYTYGSRGERT